MGFSYSRAHLYGSKASMLGRAQVCRSNPDFCAAILTREHGVQVVAGGVQDILAQTPMSGRLAGKSFSQSEKYGPTFASEGLFTLSRWRPEPDPWLHSL